MSRIEAEAREMLLQRRRALQATAAGCGLAVSNGPELALRASDPTREELAEIDAALDRIADGRYGACVSCGRALGLQRLRAIPEARYCVGCSGLQKEVG
jgi:RNA polymerase-binding transcription factor DksA